MATPGAPPAEILFTSAFSYLLNNPQFSDCIISTTAQKVSCCVPSRVIELCS